MGDENLVKDEACAQIFSPKIGRKSNLASATNQTASNYASFGKNDAVRIQWLTIQSTRNAHSNNYLWNMKQDLPGLDFDQIGY